MDNFYKFKQLCLLVFLFLGSWGLNIQQLNAQCELDALEVCANSAGPVGFTTFDVDGSSCLVNNNPTAGYVVMNIATTGLLSLNVNGDATSGFIDVAVFLIPEGVTPCDAASNNANEITCNFATSASGCASFNDPSCTSNLVDPTLMLTAGDRIIIIAENYSGASNTYEVNLSGATGAAEAGPPVAAIEDATFMECMGAMQVPNGTGNAGGGTYTADCGACIDANTGVFDPTGLAVGDYMVTYTHFTAGDPCFAEDMATITVENCCMVTATENMTLNETCEDTNDGSIVFTVASSGTASYTVNGGAPVGLPLGGGMTTLSALAPGDYTIVVTDNVDAGCSDSFMVTIEEGTISSPPTDPVADEVCAGNPDNEVLSIGATCANCASGNPPSCLFDPATMTVEVSFTGNHTFVSDLAFYLQAPDGTLLTMIDGMCCPNPGNDYNGFTLTNDPAAGDFSYSSAATPLTGSYNAQDGTAIDWSILAGQNVFESGWQVIVGDCVGGDDGNLTNVVLSFTDNGNDMSCLTDTYCINTMPIVPIYDSEDINVALNDNQCNPMGDNPASYTIDIPNAMAIPGVVTWWDAPTAGTQQAMGETIDPTGLTAEEGAFDVNTPGVYTFYAQCECPYDNDGDCVADGICESERIPVTITVHTNPTVDPEDVDVCLDGVITINGNPVEGDAPIVMHDWTITDDGGTGATDANNLIDGNLTTDFTGDFDVANWATSADGDGSVSTAGAPASVALTSSDNGTPGSTLFCITVADAGMLDFDWTYASTNGNAGWDAFGYTVNGVFTQLTDGVIGSPDGDVNQNGTATVVLAAGDQFCFDQQSFDADFGAATTTIDNFSYLISGGETVIFDAAGLTPGVVTLEYMVVDANGCTATGTSTVTIFPAPPAPMITNGFHCSTKDEAAIALTAMCEDVMGFPSNVTWWDAPTGGTEVGAGDTFDPIATGVIPNDAEGCYTFYAQCNIDLGNGMMCPGPRTKATFEVVNCDIDCEDGCIYYLVLEDSACNGWDAASIQVSVNEAWPATEYKLPATGCNSGYMVVPIAINDGGTIDLSYWNGAFETEHAWQLLNSAYEVVDATNGVALSTGYNAITGKNDVAPSIAMNTAMRAKADCPACCVAEEDFIVRITLGNFPIEQSWEIYAGLADESAQGAQVFGINATAYAGMAPGTEITYDVSLDLCETYTFVAFDGFNDGWNSGTWELISTNLNYGTEITNSFDDLYGNSLVVEGPNTPFTDEDRIEFTLPCQNCYEEPILVFGADTDCEWDGTLPLNEPFVCYPNCNHALGCELLENVFVLVDGNPSTALLVGSGTFVYSDAGTFDLDLALNPEGMTSSLPVGCHKLVHKITYCDGIMTKCTTDLNIVRDPNPSLTCNDLVQVTLSAPDNGHPLTGLNYDLGECVIKVTPDMVLEMPNFCEGEYNVTILDEAGEPLVVYGPTGYPLDQNGFEILPGNQVLEPAHCLVSATEAGKTLTYVVEHKYSENKCWGEITIEDKTNPVIECNDYDVSCNHPHALNENYSHSDTYNAAAELPANIAGGQLGLESNTWIPVNMACGAFGEIVRNIRVDIDIEHNDLTDIEFYLHLPTDLDNAITAAGGVAGPYQLTNVGGLTASNTFVLSSSSVIAFGNILGQACALTEGNSPDNIVTENSTPNVVANLGGTWYIQVVDNDQGFSTPNPNEPAGGGQITAASITLTCGFPRPYAAYDCTLDEVNLLSEMVVETHCDQADWNGSTIMRVWQAVDRFGNTSTCTQTIGLKAPFMTDIEKPADISLECGTVTPATAIPSISGTPTYDCFDLTEDHHGLCDISYTYEDLVLPTCGDGFKIIRTWTLINWCSGVTKNHEQVIKVEDTQGPAIGQDNIEVGTKTYECNANVSLIDLGLTDVCSGISSVTATFTEGGSVYQGNGLLTIVNLTNGGVLENLPLGDTEVLITAKDNCLNVTEKLITITVVDDVEPFAICDDELHVSLGGDGTARLYAEDIDEGSFDACGEVSLSVRRTDGCLGTSAWGDYVPFECCDVDELVTVELRVIDEAGNSNVCWKQALIEDVIPPTIVCPADKTLNCNDEALHTGPFNEATGDDNCTVVITHVDGGELDQCKAGTLTRTFTVTDNSDKTQDVSCTQTLTVQHISDFIVQFPADVTLDNCPDAISGGAPNISNDDCELVAVSSEDLVFDIVDDACYKIERTWTIVNWCIYDQGNPANTDLGIAQPLPRTYQDDDGYFQYVQIIKVLDEVAPVIECPEDLTFNDFTEGCEGAAELILLADDACSPLSALEFTYKIDLDNNGNFDIVENSNDASGIYPYGTHLIKWIVEDGCGNTNECSYLFSIVDAKNPTPVCLNGISIENMQTGCVGIWATDLLEYAFDNCTEDEFVENSVKMRRLGTEDALTDEITLCCEDIGVVAVEIWVEDEAGNSDFCSTYIIVQDNLGNCPNSVANATIAGSIQTEYGDNVEEVMVEVEGLAASNAIPTSGTGAFVFPNLVMNTNYAVTPEKDIQPLNGVSTYDLVVMSQHILGINALDTPYKLIAADANGDGNISTFDIVQLRQLILYVINDLPSNTSWRFVDSDYIFPNPQNPWTEAFPEQIDINAISADQLATDFIGVKVGDVTGDASANNLLGSNDRNATKTMLLTINDATVNAGETVTIDFNANDFTNINGYQFTLNFDATAMTFAGVEAGAINVTDANFGLTMLNEGIITTSWNENVASTVANDEVLFSMTFTANATTTLSKTLAITNRYTKGEAYAGTVLANVALAFNTTNGTIVAGEGFALYQNTPNPFNGATNISFNLPEASTATLKVYDVAGKVLNVVTGDYAKGLNTITIDSKDLNATGVLYYQLDTNNDSATMKMIIVD